MSLLVDRTQAALEAALDGLSRRQSLIASNLANIDTPNYRPSSIDFESALRNELDQAGLGGLGTGPGLTGTGSMTGTAMRPPSMGPSASAGLLVTTATGLPAAVAAGPGIASQSFDGSSRNDANTVDVESEMTALAETQLRYGAVAKLVTGKLTMLRSVASGR